MIYEDIIIEYIINMQEQITIIYKYRIDSHARKKMEAADLQDNKSHRPTMGINQSKEKVDRRKSDSQIKEYDLQLKESQDRS